MSTTRGAWTDEGVEEIEAVLRTGVDMGGSNPGMNAMGSL
jgi:hypothetical protein